MTQARAMVDVVGAERAADHAHEEIVLLVRALGRGEARERVAAARALDAEQLLRDEVQRLVPARLAERLVPGRRRRYPVPNVQVRPPEQRQLAHRPADPARRAPPLRVLAFAFAPLPP